MHKWTYVVLFLTEFFLASFSYGQGILIDRGVRVNGLWCFPLLTDSTQYKYLPQNAHLALDSKKLPQFSFIRYVKNEVSKQGGDKSITNAQGGGVLHFLVTYDTPPVIIEDAEQELKALPGMNRAHITGPIIFTEGRYTLISSILLNGNKPERKIITSGSAPVLEGGRIAMAFEIDAERSKLLLESFKMSTPDISILFEMNFAGLSDAYNASLKVNWTDVYNSENLKKKSSFLFVSDEVTKTCEELKRTQAIDLVVAGNDERMDVIVNNAYQKLTSLIFDPVDPEKLFGKDKATVEENINNQFSILGLNISQELNLNASKAYRIKEFKNTGTSVLNFNSRVSIDRYHTMVFNIGDLYKKYGTDPRFFRNINMDDFDFQQREVTISPDGSVIPEFDKFINNITVTLKKQHETGEPTISELNLTKVAFSENTFPVLVYGSTGDKDKEKWLMFDYKIHYEFKGGKSFETSWVSQSSPVINIIPPYERRIIQLGGDLAILKNKNVRAVIVSIGYAFLGQEQIKQITYKVGENLDEKNIEILLPRNIYSYSYEVSWIFNSGESKSFEKTTSSPIIFIDTNI